MPGGTTIVILSGVKKGRVDLARNSESATSDGRKCTGDPGMREDGRALFHVSFGRLECYTACELDLVRRLGLAR